MLNLKKFIRYVSFGKKKEVKPSELFLTATVTIGEAQMTIQYRNPRELEEIITGLGGVLISELAPFLEKKDLASVRIDV